MTALPSLVLRYLPSLAIAGAILFAIWGVISLVLDNADLRHSLKDERRARYAAELIRDQAENAVAVHRIYLDQAKGKETEYRALISELSQMDGQDEPLSSFLSNSAGRLWP